MSSQNVSTTAIYMAWNSSTGAYVTGDVSNHTLKLVKDGTEASPANSPSEVDSTNAPGAYKLTLTAAETQFGTVWIGGKSSTANVIIIPITLTFEILPTALTASSYVKADALALGGTSQTGRDVGASVLLSSGTGTGQISLSAGKVAEVVLVDTLTTYTGNTVQTGDAYARIGAAGAGLTNLGDTRVANLDAAVSTRATPAQLLTTALTESYAALHSVPTLTQLLLEIRALLAENSISGATMTTNKLDGATAAHTYTLNSSTAPTGLTTAS